MRKPASRLRLRLGSLLVLLGTAMVLRLAPAEARERPRDPVPGKDLFLLGSDGTADTLRAWSGLTVGEYDLAPADSGAGPVRRAVSAPVSVSSLSYDGVAIPLEDLAYLFPMHGIYVLRNGHRVLARPLALAALDRRHRQIQLERQNMGLADEAASPLEERAVPRYLFLDVVVESPESLQVAGYTRTRIARRSIGAVPAVVFDAPYLVPARRELGALAGAAEGALPLALGSDWRLPEALDLYASPGGAAVGRLESGTRVTASESDSAWCRVRVEGWVRTGR